MKRPTRSEEGVQILVPVLTGCCGAANPGREHTAGGGIEMKKDDPRAQPLLRPTSRVHLGEQSFKIPNRVLRATSLQAASVNQDPTSWPRRGVDNGLRERRNGRGQQYPQTKRTHQAYLLRPRPGGAL